MKTMIEDPNKGDAVCIYLEHGWIEVVRGDNTTTITVYNDDDAEVYGVIIPDETLAGGEVK
ncbi:MAG: hypothetical protein H7842_12535 [Gammaproteobacteria bacterium SHHR-1]